MSTNHPIKIAPDLGLAKATIDIALHNLEASKILHDTGYYPEAIFFLQQSIEKACKSYGYYSGIIDEKIARSQVVGHKGTRVYDRSISLLQEMLKYEKDDLILQLKLMRSDKFLSKAYPGKTLNIEGFLNQIQGEYSSGIENSKDHEMSFEALSEDLAKFNLCITACEEKEAIAYTPKNLYSLTRESNQVILSDLCPKPWDLLDADKIIDETVRGNINTELASDFLDNFFTGFGAITPLIELAVITQPYENISRYVTNGQSPVIVYDSNHPMVRAFPMIYTMSKKIFSRISKYYDKHPV